MQIKGTVSELYCVCVCVCMGFFPLLAIIYFHVVKCVFLTLYPENKADNVFVLLEPCFLAFSKDLFPCASLSYVPFIILFYSYSS